MQREQKVFTGGPKAILRLLFVVVLTITGAFLMSAYAASILEAAWKLFNRENTPDANVRLIFTQPQSVFPMALVGAILGGVVANSLIRAIDLMLTKWDKMDIGDKVTLFIGIFAGLIGSLPPLFLLQNIGIHPVLGASGVLIITVGLAALSVYALQSMTQVLPWTQARGKRSGARILDTNVIIDGRIYDVIRTGFLDGSLYVPGFVLDELQHIADSHDALRRQRGRRGLDVLRHMQADFNLEVRGQDRLAPDMGDGVDQRLVRLAKALGADIITNDFNLNRVASLQDVKVLSLNDLALALRSNVMPQEQLLLTLTREGNQIGQGVGYLEDGTMVVVENGKAHIGETIDVTVTQVIQTERGKMIFAEADPETSADFTPRKKRPTSK
jgi:uncharacterized protein YacL